MANEDVAPWDVIVIGAGPSGSSAAYDLATAGLRVLLLEKREMPRDKLCGGAVSAVARSFLRFTIPPEYEEWQCYGARVHYGEWTISMKLRERIAILVTRRHFDHFLVTQAQTKGTHLRYEKVLSVKVDTDDGVLVETEERTHRGKMAIIAAGASSNLIASVRRQDRNHEKAIGLEQDFPVMTPDPYADLEGLIDIYFGVGEFGYGWVFHHGKYYNVGVGGLLSKMKDPKDIMRRFWIDRGFPPEEFNPKGHMIPCGGLQRVLTSKRLLLAGDSAGFVDPFYGEGIAYAIRSGQIAASVAADAVRNNDYSRRTLRVYERLCRREFQANLWYSLQLTRIMHWMPAVFLRLLSSDPDVLQKYLLVPLGELSYFRYLTWLLPRVPSFLLKSFFKSVNGRT